jgi:hypothetical protein
MADPKEPLDLKRYQGQYGKVQAVFSMLLGLCGFDSYGKFIGGPEVQKTAFWMRTEGMGDQLAPTLFALLLHEYHQMDFSEEQILAYWQRMLHESAVAQMASTPAPPAEFTRSH